MVFNFYFYFGVIIDSCEVAKLLARGRCAHPRPGLPRGYILRNCGTIATAGLTWARGRGPIEPIMLTAAQNSPLPGVSLEMVTET